MKVILQKDIPNLGEAGDIVEVKNGYARNYLLPRNMVILANAANQKQRKHQERMIRLKKEIREKNARALADKFTNIVCNFPVRVGEHGKMFGSVTALDIAQNLFLQGFSLDKRKVHLAEPIKALGEYDVTVRLAAGIDATVKVVVADQSGDQAPQIEAPAEVTVDAVEKELVIEDVSE